MIKGLLSTLVFCVSAVVYAQDDALEIEDYQREELPQVEVQRFTHDGKLGGSFILPSYPEKAVKMNQEGVTMVYAWVSPEGKAKSVSVLKSSGYVEFDLAAKETVSEGRFRKTDKWTIYLIPVRFKLK